MLACFGLVFCCPPHLSLALLSLLPPIALLTLSCPILAGPACPACPACLPPGPVLSCPV